MALVSCSQMAIWLSYALRQKNIIQVPLILSECVNHWYVSKSEWGSVRGRRLLWGLSNFVAPNGAKLMNNLIHLCFC